MVIANNDGMALGAIEALNTVGYNTGDGDRIPVYGVDATAEAKQAIADGKMDGSIMQDAAGMSEAIAGLASNVLEGNDLMDGADSFGPVDEGVNKVRIPYQIYIGE